MPTRPIRARLRAAARALAAVALTALLVLTGSRALAAEAPDAAADPALEARVLKIAAELRCLVCQNQTIADSNAGLAVDLRNQVRDMLRRGDTPEQITDYMTARYGDFVLYRPPVKGSTALLWYGPAALLALAVAALVLIVRRRARLPADRFETDTDPDQPTVADEPPARPAPHGRP